MMFLRRKNNINKDFELPHEEIYKFLENSEFKTILNTAKSKVENLTIQLEENDYLLTYFNNLINESSSSFEICQQNKKEKKNLSDSYIITMNHQYLISNMQKLIKDNENIKKYIVEFKKFIKFYNLTLDANSKYKKVHSIINEFFKKPKEVIEKEVERRMNVITSKTSKINIKKQKLVLDAQKKLKQLIEQSDKINNLNDKLEIYKLEQIKLYKLISDLEIKIRKQKKQYELKLSQQSKKIRNQFLLNGNVKINKLFKEEKDTDSIDKIKPNNESIDKIESDSDSIDQIKPDNDESIGKIKSDSDDSIDKIKSDSDDSIDKIKSDNKNMDL